MSDHERNATCDRCGFVFKHYELRKEWNGLMVCKDDWEPRHPQDYARVPRTEKAPEWTRPEQPDTYIDVTYDTSSGIQENTIPSGTFNSSTL
jgi:hypothetical protein